jgi:hypothetical protein
MADRGMIRKIADACDVDHRTARSALKAAGRDLESITLEEGEEIVRAIADPARVNGHKATRVTSNPDLRDARTRHEDLKARKLELETGQLEGRLIDRADVTETITAVIASARTACLALGVRCAPKLVGLTDPKQIARTIETEMRRILEDLADDVAFFTQREEDALS